MKKIISILGSTGSIGHNSLKILSKKKKLFKINILAANKNYRLICKQIDKFKPKIFIINDLKVLEKVKKKFKNNKIKIIKDIEYPDHYEYSQEDLNKILKIAKNNNAKILTTEKDYLRLNQKNQDNINFIKIFLKIDKIDKLRERLKILYENN